MKNLPRHWAFTLAFTFILFLFNQAAAQTIYGLSGDKLVAFQASNPGVLTQSAQITGLIPGHALMGLDFRPNTGQLYGLGYNSVTGAAQLYTINRTNAVATPVGSGSVMLNPNIMDIGFDFNPTVDRIRVTGADNSNYRMHPVTGAVVATDGNLAYAAGDVNAGADPGVGASAYTNSYIGTTSTTLYNIDIALNALVSQIPPNNGTLNTIGGTGLTLNAIDQSLDLDITFDAAMARNIAYLAANTGASINDDLFTIDLTTGAATMVGSVGIPLRDIAVAIDAPATPALTGNLLYALTTGNNLISFDSNLPGSIRSIVAVTGITAGQALSGLDSRPATGELYAIGYNNGTGEARLYTINPATGAATAIGTAPVMLAAGMGKVSFDFNPTVDRIRVMGSNNSNYRMHPVTGAIAATDGSLAYAGPNAGANPSIGAAAYTNSFNGAATTTLYDYDDTLNIFASQIPPNNGTLNTIGASGIMVNLSDPSADLDIYYDLATGTNTAYFAANVGAATSDNLYTINLSTGAATLVGKIGNGIAVTDIAAAITVAPAETACDENMIGGVRFELISVRKNAAGNETYRIRVTNTNASALNFVAFALPKGVVASSPGEGATYNAPSTRQYAVRNPNFSPFYSIRFKTNGTGLANGQSDIFEYTLPKITDVVYIKAFARLNDGTGNEVYLNTYNCPVQPFANLKGDEEPDARSENTVYAKSGLNLYPNPSSGQIFVELNDWDTQQLNLSIISATGQLVQQLALEAGNGTVALNLPESLANGIYLLEVKAVDGTRAVKRFVVQRK